MEQSGIFISYQMAEAIELIESLKLNTVDEKLTAYKKLQELKERWLTDTLPGTDIKIGEKIAGMQEITIDELIQLSIMAKQAETYTLENAGAFQYVLVIDESGKFYFDFDKLDKIAALARKNNKKIIIDSAVVFGDIYPSKLEHLDKETISKLIGEYTKRLTEKYGDIIERIDIFNAIFERGIISGKNNSEEFWIKKFGNDYAQEIIDIVRNNIDFRMHNIKLGWNEFYLTNSKFKQRKLNFLNRIKSIKGLDVIGIQDRFMSGESLEYILKSLVEICITSKETNRDVCITEFSCSASGTDLRIGDTNVINSKIQRIIAAVKAYSAINETIKRIEGRVSDKFDYNHNELKKYGFEISTTGKKIPDFKVQNYHETKKTPFDIRNPGEEQIYQKIREKNKIIKQQKSQQRQFEKPKMRVLTKPNSIDANNNKGFANAITLSLIISFFYGILLIVAYIVIGVKLYG